MFLDSNVLEAPVSSLYCGVWVRPTLTPQWWVVISRQFLGLEGCGPILSHCPCCGIGVFARGFKNTLENFGLGPLSQLLEIKTLLIALGQGISDLLAWSFPHFLKGIMDCENNSKH